MYDKNAAQTLPPFGVSDNNVVVMRQKHAHQKMVQGRHASLYSRPFVPFLYITACFQTFIVGIRSIKSAALIEFILVFLQNDNFSCLKIKFPDFPLTLKHFLPDHFRTCGNPNMVPKE